MHPSTNGATIVYNTYILPLYEEHSGKINEMEKMAQQKMQEAQKGAKSFVDEKKSMWEGWSLRLWVNIWNPM